jgi:hypothetical protein
LIGRMCFSLLFGAELPHCCLRLKGILQMHVMYESSASRSQASPAPRLIQSTIKGGVVSVDRAKPREAPVREEDSRDKVTEAWRKSTLQKKIHAGRVASPVRPRKRKAFDDGLSQRSVSHIWCDSGVLMQRVTICLCQCVTRCR